MFKNGEVGYDKQKTREKQSNEQSPKYCALNNIDHAKMPLLPLMI